jgi:hemerythrin HHE cation binding domain-containing protein
MNVDTHQFRCAHAELESQLGLSAAAKAFPLLTHEEREDIRREASARLREHVDPHTRLDELILYPAVAERLGDPLVAVSMNYDHLAIREWIKWIDEVDVADTARCQQLLYGLDALIRVHMWKENELFLTSLETSSWPPAEG